MAWIHICIYVGSRHIEGCLMTHHTTILIYTSISADTKLSPRVRISNLYRSESHKQANITSIYLNIFPPYATKGKVKESFCIFCHFGKVIFEYDDIAVQVVWKEVHCYNLTPVLSKEIFNIWAAHAVMVQTITELHMVHW